VILTEIDGIPGKCRRLACDVTIAQQAEVSVVLLVDPQHSGGAAM